MNNKVVFSIAVVLALISIFFPSLYAAEQYAVDVRSNVEIPMADGAGLSANLFLPKAEGKFPVIP